MHHYIFLATTVSLEGLGEQLQAYLYTSNRNHVTLFWGTCWVNLAWLTKRQHAVWHVT